MNKLDTQFPIFPIDLFLLPGGVTRLRIFEARYLRMVSLANSLGGFIISSEHQGDPQLAKWGSWVEIINFDQGEDGILEIDVECKSLVDIESLSELTGQLRFATVSEIEHWSNKYSNGQCVGLYESLKSFIESQPLLNELYSQQLNEITGKNPYWIVSRWLELLPIRQDVKRTFIYQSSYMDAKKMVNSIIHQ